MAFDAQGRFIPLAGMAPAAGQSATQTATSQSAKVNQAAQLGAQVTPAISPVASATQGAAIRAAMPAAPIVPQQNQMAAAPAAAPPVAAPIAAQAAVVPVPAAPPPQPQVQLGAPRQQMQMQQMPQQSVEQIASRGGAQSVQNFMSALNQVGAGGNNAMMNAPGQLGQAAQMGFQGFGSNGQGYGPSMVQQGYTGPMGSQLGSYGNQASLNNNFMQSNSASGGGYGQNAGPQAWTNGVQQGGTGGVFGQPAWVTPKPWTQIANADQGVVGSLRPNTGDAQYSAGTYNNPKDGIQPGQITPGQFYTDAPPPGTYNPGEQVSDERAKENISDAKGELQDFLDNLGCYSYEYKDKKHGEGRYISPMAQEFEKSKLGAQAVITNDEGVKMVNYGRLIGVQSAALALLNQKYNALESKFSSSVLNKVKAKNGK